MKVINVNLYSMWNEDKMSLIVDNDEHLMSYLRKEPPHARDSWENINYERHYKYFILSEFYNVPIDEIRYSQMVKEGRM